MMKAAVNARKIGCAIDQQTTQHGSRDERRSIDCRVEHVIKQLVARIREKRIGGKLETRR